MYRIEMFNLSRQEIFILPTEHSDWTEACTEGQQYVFNRRAENAEILYFRVVDSCNFIPEKEEEIETLTCGIDCDRCPDAWECDDAFYIDRKSIDRDNIDPSHPEPEPKYFEGLLIQKMIERLQLMDSPTSD